MLVAAIRDEVLVIEERSDPVPDGRQVAVEVKASGVNRADVLQRAGRYPAPPGVPDDIAGLELAGEVVAVGRGVRRWAVGHRVMGLVGGGAHATRCLVDEDELVPAGDLDWVTAGAVPEVFVTAHDAMITQGGLRSGQTVLVHAIGSGVGTAALQLAHAVGARVVGTTRTAAKLDRATEELGLDAGVVVEDPTDRDTQDRIRDLGPIDVVVDLVGGDYVGLDLAVTASQGRIVVVGLVAGAKTQANLGLLLSKRLSVTGTVLRPRPAHQKAEAMRAFESQVLPLIQSGRLRPELETTMPLSEANAAYDLLSSNDTYGKVVVQM